MLLWRRTVPAAVEADTLLLWRGDGSCCCGGGHLTAMAAIRTVPAAEYVHADLATARWYYLLTDNKP